MNSTGWRPPPLVGPPPTAGPSHPFYSAPQSFQPPQHPFYAPPQPQFPPQPYFQPPQPTPQFNSYPPQPMMMDPAYSMQPPANNVYPTQPPVVDLSLDQSALEAEAFLNSLNNFDKNVDSRGTRRKSRSRSKSPAKTWVVSSLKLFLFLFVLRGSYIFCPASSIMIEWLGYLDLCVYVSARPQPAITFCMVLDLDYFKFWRAAISQRMFIHQFVIRHNFCPKFLFRVRATHSAAWNNLIWPLKMVKYPLLSCRTATVALCSINWHFLVMGVP